VNGSQKRTTDHVARRLLRRGVVTLEIILVLPILVIAFIAIFEFGILAIVLGTATAAVVDGAREGALVFPSSLPYDNEDPDPTSEEDIADAIALQMNRFLAVVGLEIQEPGSPNEDPMKQKAYVRIVRDQEIAERGDLSLAADCVTTGPSPGPGETVVTLCFPLVNSPEGRPVPDLLSTFGFSLADRHYNATSRALLQ
jgi:hypothetical protein